MKEEIRAHENDPAKAHLKSTIDKYSGKVGLPDSIWDEIQEEIRKHFGERPTHVEKPQLNRTIP